jgi:L-fuconolactonase
VNTGFGGCRFIDAHVHVWDRARNPQAWIDPATMAPIDRDFSVFDLDDTLRSVPAVGAVVVQASNSTQESLDLLGGDLPKTVLGVVGWVDLSAESVHADLYRLRSARHGSRLVGLRHLAHIDPDPAWLLRAEVSRALDLLGGEGVPFDLVLHPRQLGMAAQVVAAHPQVQFVLDHLGKPPIGSADLGEWTRGIADLAALPNIVAKISGLTIEGDRRSWSTEELRDPIELALELFGPDRLMFGSDWPLVRLSGGYAAWLRAAVNLVGALDPDDVSEIFGGTAARIYRLRGAR